MSKYKFILVLLVILAGLCAVFLMFYGPDRNKTTTRTAEQNTKALIGGPFSLVDHHGKNVTEKDFRGKYMLIYFGYTYCPDICPMELQIMSDALDRVPGHVLKDIVPVFISVDPDRDTVEVLSQYVPAFHEKMVGLTGTTDQIKAVKKTWRVYAAKEKTEEGADPDSYLVSHTSYIYLMDRTGEYVTHFKSQTDPEMMARRLEEIVAK
ncbi:MAG: SCO family protein [Alphaproteobacteria bacterium]|nr:MAG: SCO family protein [Alphaproteobacteria bacterium]